MLHTAIFGHISRVNYRGTRHNGRNSAEKAMANLVGQDSTKNVYSTISSLHSVYWDIIYNCDVCFYLIQTDMDMHYTYDKS